MLLKGDWLEILEIDRVGGMDDLPCYYTFHPLSFVLSVDRCSIGKSTRRTRPSKLVSRKDLYA